MTDVSYSETLEESGDYRVRLVVDEYADEPYDDGAAPILRIDVRDVLSTDTCHVDQGGRPRDHDDNIVYAVKHWQTYPGDRNWPLFEKYLRAFYGVRHIETWRSDGGPWWYVVYDARSAREYAGIADDSPHRARYAGSTLAEYRSWAEGDVWEYVVEKRVMWHTDDRAVEDHHRESWETVDSCGGYYGYGYARQEAVEAYRATLPMHEVPS